MKMHFKMMLRFLFLLDLVLILPNFIGAVTLTDNVTTSSSSLIPCGEAVQLTCNVPTIPNVISWLKGSASMTNCFGNSDNDCLPATVDHYHFSSQSNDFFMLLNTTKVADNQTSFVCSDTSDSKSISFSVEVALDGPSCILEEVSSDESQVTMVFKTNCVNLASSFTMTWFANNTAANSEEELNATTSSDSTDFTGCTSVDCPGTKQTRTASFAIVKPGLESTIKARVTYPGKTITVYSSRTYKVLKDCKCDCCIHKIVWTVVSTLLSVPSLGWTLFVINDFRRRQWLTNNLGEQAHLCMIGWVVLNLVYSIIAAILFFVLVCKNDCCEEVCACICNCWPIYIIIGYVLKAGDVIVDIIGGIAFKEGDEDDDENPQHGMSNKKRGRTAAASNTVPMSKAHVHATKEPKDAKHKEAIDSHSSGSAVSRNDIYPHLNETASEKPLRQQPLPPVGGQKGHGRGLSANFGDNNDTMPAVDTKRLPPVMDRNEDTEVKKKKKKKKKNKEEREQD